jgi:hypothetical protein
MTAMTLPNSAEGDQRPAVPRAQGNAWLRLLLAMTVPTLWLLIGISLTR